MSQPTNCAALAKSLGGTFPSMVFVPLPRGVVKYDRYEFSVTALPDHRVLYAAENVETNARTVFTDYDELVKFVKRLVFDN